MYGHYPATCNCFMVHVQLLRQFVVTADKVKTFMRHLADKIAAIWHKSPGEVLGYVRARMLFAVLHATNMCIHGSRVKWRRRMEIKTLQINLKTSF